MRTAVFFNFFIEANLMAVIAIALMAVIRKYLRRPLGNSALSFGWLLVALRLMLPVSFVNPLINTIRSPFAPDMAIRPIAGQIKVRAGDLMNSIGSMLRRAGNRPGSRAVFDIRAEMETGVVSIQLFHLYLIGLALVTLWLIYRNVRFYRALAKGRVGALPDEQAARYRGLCAARNVKPVPVHLVDPLPAAGLVGVFRPRIVLPLTTPPEEIDMTLSHELCHLKSRDHLWSLLRLTCCAVHWFNPLVWMAASMSRTDLEMKCDDAVTGAMDERQKEAYTRVLVQSAARKPAAGMALLEACMTMTGKRLKQRVSAIVKGAKPVRAFSVAFAVVASMCLAGAFATSETAEQIAMGVSPYAEEKYITDQLKGTASLKDEAAAEAYAKALIEKLDPTLKDLKVKEISREGKWFYVPFTDKDGQEVSCEIASNGVVRTYRRSKPNLWEKHAPLPMGGDRYGKAAQNALIKAALEQAEVLAPGCTVFITGADIVDIWTNDTGDYVYLSARTRDGYYAPFLIMHVTPEGTQRLMDCAFAGNG